MKPYENLISKWEKEGQGPLSAKSIAVNLNDEAVKNLELLTQRFPRVSRETLIKEILSATLISLEQHFPYKQGDKVIATDECGDAIYEDCGLTPQFLGLCKKFQKEMVTEPQATTA